MQVNLENLNPGTWFEMEDGGRICLRVCAGDDYRAIRKAATKKISDLQYLHDLQLKSCPFILSPGKKLSWSDGECTVLFAEGGIKKMFQKEWLIKGIGYKLLMIERREFILWIDQPFEIWFNGKLFATFNNTAEYTKIQEQ